MTVLGRTTVALTLAVATLGARAQMNLGQGYVDLSASLMSVNAFNNVLEGVKRPVRGSGGKRPVGKAPVPKPARLTYTESPAVTKKVERNFVAFLRQSGLNEGADSMAKFLKTGDFRKVWAQEVASNGLRRGDVADALAAYWAANWAIANRKTDVSTAQVRGIRRQLAPILARDRTMAGLSNARRQEISEVWMINYVAQVGGYAAALKSGDAATLGKVSDAAVTRFKNEVKIDLRTVNLTGNGFTRR